MSINTSDFLQPVISLAQSAAIEILKFYYSELTVQQKADNTPLTAADLAAHEVIVKGLTALTPDIPVLSEEDASATFEERQKWETYWLVDPLDGTREFINHNGEFSINIALVKNHQAIMGVIYAPVTKTCYYAIKGFGAFKLERDGHSQPISVRITAPEQVHVAGSRSYLDNSLDNFLKNLGKYELTKMGSSLKSCLVAEGKVDIYARLGPTSEWDTAAAQCIVEEAGGLITTTDMQPLLYNTKDSLLNPHFFVFGDKSVNWASYL